MMRTMKNNVINYLDKFVLLGKTFTFMFFNFFYLWKVPYFHNSLFWITEIPEIQPAEQAACYLHFVHC